MLQLEGLRAASRPDRNNRFVLVEVWCKVGWARQSTLGMDYAWPGYGLWPGVGKVSYICRRYKVLRCSVQCSRAGLSLPLGYSNFRDWYLSRSIELSQSWKDRYIQPHEYINNNAECRWWTGASTSPDEQNIPRMYCTLLKQPKTPLDGLCRDAIEKKIKS